MKEELVSQIINRLNNDNNKKEEIWIKLGELIYSSVSIPKNAEDEERLHRLHEAYWDYLRHDNLFDVLNIMTLDELNIASRQKSQP